MKNAETNLVNSLKRYLGKMSYFNAAEGSWSKEGASRGVCQSRCIKHSTILAKNHGWTVDQFAKLGYGFLVSDYDYYDYGVKQIIKENEIG